MADLDKGSVIIGPNKLRTQVIPMGGLMSSAELLDKGGWGRVTSYRYNESRPPNFKTRKGYWEKRPFTPQSLKAGMARMRELMEKINL